MNHWIVLYLTGKYPGHYTVPDKLFFIDEVQLLFPTEFTDSKLKLLESVSEYEFYFTILNKAERLSREKYWEFLDKLKIPPEIKSKFAIGEKIYDLNLIEEFLKNATEEEFGEYLITPLLIKQGYNGVHFKGKVNSKDNGLDYYPMYYASPSGEQRYVGVQLKAAVISSGDANGQWQTLKSEIESAFTDVHAISNGNRVKLDEYLIFNSKKIHQGAFEDIAKISLKENYTISLFDFERLKAILQITSLPLNIEQSILNVAKRK